MTAAMAIVVSIYYIYYGVKKSGFRFFFKGFSIDGIIITFVDTLELFVRPFSLALRLFANIFAGEILVGTILGLVWFLVPLPFMLFELFVALIQALVFTLLSTTYISMAIQEE
jgi:F-type H+-transporting ATPase subunit a